MAVKIQLAIQGGGAKISDLLAAAEAVAELQSNGTLTVTRLAGTSAGAIVACLLATGRSIPDVKQILLRDGVSRLATIVPEFMKPANGNWRRWRQWSTIARRVMRGKALFEESELRRFLADLFGSTKMPELDVETFVVAADIREGGPKYYSKSTEDTVVNCLLDSCGIPYFFRAHGNLGAGRSYVDGGICENLPSDALSGRKEEQALMLERFGRIVGISFDESKLRKEDPGAGLVQFSMALVDTVIGNAIQRAKGSIGPQFVHLIETDVGTFDFEKAVRNLDSAQYRLVKKTAQDWFERLVRTLEDEEKRKVVTLRDQWHEDSPASLDRMLDVTKAYDGGLARTTYQVVESTLIVTAYSLLPDDDPRRSQADAAILICDLVPNQAPVYCIATSVDARANSWSWSATDKRGKAIDVTPLPGIRSSPTDTPKPAEDKQWEYWALLFFSPALLPGNSDQEPYKIMEKCEVPGMMAPLTGGFDFLEFCASGENTYEKVNLVLIAPKEFLTSRRVKPTNRIGCVEAGEMKPDELLKYRLFAPQGFEPIGWSGGPVAPKRKIGVDFSSEFVRVPLDPKGAPSVKSCA